MDIKNLSNKWMPLKPVLLKGLREVLTNQHLAAQLIASTGKHMIPEAKDNSNAAMEFSASRKMLISEKIPAEKPVRVGLNILDLTLYILSSRLEVLQVSDLSGHTTSEGFNFIKKHLANYGANVSSLELTMDYTLPTGPVDKEKYFRVEYPDIAEETVKYRANAKFLLKFFNRVFEKTSDIRVWPKNFCTSSLIYSSDEKHAVEYGFSPQNELLDEPHFYVLLHAGDGFKYPEELPVLRGGGRWDKENDQWKGAYLRISDVWENHNPVTQFEVTSEFFASGIESGLKMLEKI